MRARLIVMASIFTLVLTAPACFFIAGYDGLEFYDERGPFGIRLTPSRIEQVDVLLVVDNSRGMGNKQAILRETMAPFIASLVAPPCADDDGTTVARQIDGSCPPDSSRVHEAVTDMHIGVVTTSLGGHGADACSGEGSPSENDAAHLVARSDVAIGAPEVETWQGLGFLAWDPAGTKNPPGLDEVDDLVDKLVQIIDGVGEQGCGYEAQLESWYRFAVDPNPYQSITVSDGQAELIGTDTDLLDQRAAFMRNNSLVAIVMLTDENDCSFRDGGFYYQGAQVLGTGTNPYLLPKPTSECAVEPANPCCKSCGQLTPGDGCDAESNCDGEPLDTLDDKINVRCFDQKRRFGIDFLYPIERYVQGLTEQTVADRDGNIVTNPLLQDRDPGRVVLAGIVGVPWQDIARQNSDGEPDLVDGLDPLGRASGGFKSAFELAQPVSDLDSAWALMLAKPGENEMPVDPFMIEAIQPRTGSHPLTGDSIAPGDQSQNDINGHEYTVPDNDDLQNACIFGGKSCEGSADPNCRAGMGNTCSEDADCLDGLFCAPDGNCARNCAAPQQTACVCAESDNDNPVCVDDNGNFTQYQYADHARPAVRPLQVLEALGDAAAVGSSCPYQVNDASEPAFGYAPAMSSAVADRLAASLRDQLCVDETIPTDANGVASCVLLEATTTEPGGCQCAEATGRRHVGNELQAALDFALADPLYETQKWSCFCELLHTPAGFELEACQGRVSEPVVTISGKPVHGWCYVDAEADPPLGEPTIAAACPSDQKRLIRLVGDATPARGATSFLYCNG